MDDSLFLSEEYSRNTNCHSMDDDIQPDIQIERNRTVEVDGELFDLSDEQSRCFDGLVELIEKSKNTQFFASLTGPAGSGKTLLLKLLRCKIQQVRGHQSCLVTAPTSIAAKNLNCRTIHSTFWLSRTTEYEELSREAKQHLYYELGSKKIIMIDVINFVSSDLLSRVDYVLQEVLGIRKPFGGLSIIVFGDFMQCEPIERPPVWRDISIALRSERDEKMPNSPKLLWSLFQHFELSENKRLCGDPLRGLFDAGVLESLRTTGDGGYVHSSLFPQCELGADKEVGVMEVIKNLKEMKSSHPNKNITVLVPSKDMLREFHNTILQHAEETKTLEPTDCDVDLYYPRTGYPHKGSLEDAVLRLAIGSKVMVTCNLPSLLHGTFGIVEAFGENAITVKFPSGSIDIQRCGWHCGRQCWKQFPLCLAEAFTIHMAQGMEFDGAILVAKYLWNDSAFECLGPGVIYTAISRVKDPVLLRITPITNFGFKISASARDEVKRMRNGEPLGNENGNDVTEEFATQIISQQGSEIRGTFSRKRISKYIS